MGFESININTQVLKVLKRMCRLRNGDKNTQKNYTKKLLMTQITMIVWSLTKSKTPWSVASSRP